MNINRGNYELFVIDYLDGKLDAGDVASLMVFLAANPDLQAEFDMLSSEPATLLADQKTMPGREFLKKPEFSFLKKEFDRDLAAKLEGDLTPEQEKALDMNFVIYPELHNEWALMQQSRLEPEMHIQYPDKQSLKKRVLSVRMRVAYYSAAAAILILAGLALLRPLPSGQMLLDGNTAVSFNVGVPVQQNTRTEVLPAADVNVGIPAQRKAQVKRSRPVNITLTEGIAYQPEAAAIGGVLRKPVKIEMPPLPVKPVDNFYTLDQILTARLKQESKDVLIEENAVNDEKKRPEIAALALKVFNKVAGTALKLKKKYDESGNVVGVGIASNDFEFYNGR